MAGRIYSVGYEGRTLDELVERLRNEHVTTLVDVRLTPISRKPGFSRRRLAEALEAAGMDYVNEKDLGNPRDNRAAFHRNDVEAGRTRMKSILTQPVGAAAVDRVVALASKHRIALLCVERDAEHCHRSVVSALALERNPAIKVVPIT